MCNAVTSIYSSAYMNAYNGTLAQKVRTNLGVTGNLSAAKVLVEWGYSRSSHTLLIPFTGDDYAGLWIKMSGPGSSLATYSPSITANSLADVRAYRIDISGAVNLQSMNNATYSRGIFYDPSTDRVDTVIMDDETNKAIGRDSGVPISVRPLSVALPVGSAQLSNYPVKINAPKISAQDMASQSIIVSPVVPPECVEPLNATPNGGLSGQSIIVCPVTPTENEEDGTCPTSGISSQSIAVGNALTRQNTFGILCAYTEPTPIYYCPAVPSTLLSAVDAAQAEVRVKVAEETTAIAAYGFAKYELARSPQTCGAPRSVKGALCYGRVAFDIVTATYGMATAGQALEDALDRRDAAQRTVAQYRRDHPCYYKPPA